MKRRRVTAALAAAACVVGAVALMTTGVIQAQSGPSTSKSLIAAHGDERGVPQTIFKVNVAARMEGSVQRWTEWVDVATGAWRVSAPGITRIYNGRNRYAAIEKGAGAYVRTGSARFIGYLADTAVSRAAVFSFVGMRTTFGHGTTVSRIGERRFQVRRYGQPFTVTVVRSASRARAAEVGLFSVPKRGVTSLATERGSATRPTLPIQAYWFGPSVLGRNATTVVEFSRKRTPEQIAAGVSARKDATAYIAFYELPTAGGASSAVPGQLPPEGELQVVSQPVDSATARGAIDAFNGVNGDITYPAWPRFEILLRDGQRVTVVLDLAEGAPTGANDRYSSFSVITSTTLVSVIGKVTLSEIRTLAAQLSVVS